MFNRIRMHPIIIQGKFTFGRNKKELQGKFLAFYLIGYATMRFLGEFFREPDAQIGFLLGGLTLGQLFSGAMLFGGLGLLYKNSQRSPVRLPAASLHSKA